MFYRTDPNGIGSKLYAFADSSEADDPIQRRSTGGYIVYYNGSPVAWSTGLQRLTTLSTCESEYVQAALATKEVLYLQELFEYAGHGQQDRTLIYEDNEAAVCLSDNPVNRGMTKHIGRCFHFIWQSSEFGWIGLIPVDGERNVADIFTKPLPYQAFARHRGTLGVHCIDKTAEVIKMYLTL